MENNKTARRIENSGVPKRFIGKTMDDYDVKKGSADAFDAVDKYITTLQYHLPPEGDGVGMTLTGPPGVGKSLLASIIVQEAIQEGWKARFLTLVGYVHLLQRRFDLRASLGVSREAYDDFAAATRLVDRLFNVDLLVIDDVGKEHLTSTRFAQDEYDYLLRRRFDKGLPTIQTSNWTREEWKTAYSPAMASFLNEAAPLVGVIPKDDYRTHEYR